MESLLTECVNDRCGEIYLSSEGTLLFLCCLCNETFKGYGIYLAHIISDHDLPIHSVEEIEDISQSRLADELEIEPTDVKILDEGVSFSEMEKELKESNFEMDADLGCEINYNSNSQYIINEITEDGQIETKSNSQYIINEITEDGQIETSYKSNSQNIIDESTEDYHMERELPETTDEYLKEKNEVNLISNDDENAKIKEKRKKDRSQYPCMGLFECPVCQLCIKGKSNLEKHILRHDDHNKRFQCSFCPKRFHVKFELRQHESSHTGHRPYLCTICGRRFVSNGKLNEHTNMIHENKRNHTCEVCNKQYYSIKYLRKHMITHTNERAYKCEVCEMSFKFRKTLLTHMKLHENKREYECEFCDASFNQRPALHSHMKTRHKDLLALLKNGTEEKSIF